MKRIVFLLVFLIYYETLFSQPDANFDTLKKYSYLLIGVSFKPKSISDKPDLSNLHVENYATGFFVRVENNLYLVSAYHVLTMVDVYKGVKTNSNIDFMLVRYLDSTNNMKVWLISIAEIIKKSPPIFFLNKPDIYCLNVTGELSDGKIYSLEGILFNKVRKPRKIPTKKIISYGYPSNGIFLYQTPNEYCNKIQPSLYEGYIADSTHYDPAYGRSLIDSLYLTTSPICYGGTSGSPVFVHYSIGKRKWIEFAGVQSGKNERYNCSYIARKEEVIRLLREH